MPSPYSTITPPSPPLSPTFEPHTTPYETISTQTLIDNLRLTPHPEGGYYVELDRDPLLIPSPFVGQETYTTTATTTLSGDPNLRNASTSILYLLTPRLPQGGFHRNRGRTVHTLVQGRGRYVIIHDDEGEDVGVGIDQRAADRGGQGRGEGEKNSEGDDDGVDDGDGDGDGDVKGQPKTKRGKRIETFVVGKDVEAGERVCWIVEGGKYKASYLLAEEGVDEWESRLLISETVVPGFEFADHDFLTEEKFDAILEPQHADELRWLLRTP